ncbi:MAG: hypothetical protein JSV92_01235, partial [archaeon]
YGTDDSCDIVGAEKTFEYVLRAQVASVEVLYETAPDIVPKNHRDELVEKADLKYINPDRIREIEEKTKHDVIAINTVWEEQVSPEAAAHINKTRTSADSTSTAWALQAKEYIEAYTDSLENLRDIILEKATLDEWFKTPHMDKTHGYDALPTVAGRPLVNYAERLQYDIDLLEYFYETSLVGKWGDATGCHHSAKSYGLDGIKLQENYCKKLGIGHMIAPAQIPGREFNTRIVFGINLSQETIADLAQYILDGRDQDCGIFKVPKKREGSTAMPHKNEMGGNPIKEEQAVSSSHSSKGDLTTSEASIRMKHARDLVDSSSNRITFEKLFKFSDHTARRMAGAVYELILIPERCVERVKRTFGITTSQQVMNYLTDQRRTDKPLTRKNAHRLAAELATKAYNEKIEFKDVCLQDERINSRFDEKTIKEITDPFQYIGESQSQIEMVFDLCHGKKSVPSKNYLRNAEARKVA